MNFDRIKPKLRRALLAGAVLAVVAVVTGCRTFSFYTQAAKGQIQLLSGRKSIVGLMQSTNTPPELKARFEVLADLRKFSEAELSLPVDGHYNQYEDLHRKFVLWNVEAAPEFSMTPKKWWYPVVGRQKYRGYFSNAGATNYAAYLQRKDYDTYVAGVPAYSTLGWFKDIALNTFIFYSDADLAELIFHELAHQQVFARGDTDFNEAFATTVGQEGARRWLRARRSPEELQQYQVAMERNGQFVSLIESARFDLEKIYGDTRDEDGELKPNQCAVSDPEGLRREKERIYADLVAGYERLKRNWDGDATYDMFFSRQLNNAKLNSVAAYYDLVPGFQALLALKKGDMKTFYAAAQKLADMPKKERRQWLKTLGTLPDGSNAEAHDTSLAEGRQLQ